MSSGPWVAEPARVDRRTARLHRHAGLSGGRLPRRDHCLGAGAELSRLGDAGGGDDTSPDSTAALVAQLAREEPRLRLLRQADTGGAARARNAALAEARGRYVAFLDADDLWLPQKLERQLAFLEKTGAALCYTAYRRMSQEGRQLSRVIPAPTSLTYRQLLKNTAIAMLTAMVDRTQVGPLRLAEAGYDDYLLWLALLKRGLLARGLNEDLARYRVVPGSLSSRPLRSLGWVWRIYRQHQGLGRGDAAWCLGHYALRAAWKRFAY